MMKTLMKLTLLTALLSVVGCNESISPEIKNANATGGSSSDPAPVPVQVEHTFKIVNSSAPGLNYKVHKTGPGNKAAACEVSNTATPAGMPNRFATDPTNNDISCFFEAEELSLYHSGMSFKIEASPNACEFVAYAPYSYYNRMPGDSSGAYTVHRCADDVDTAFLLANTITTPGCDLLDGGAGLTPFSAATDAELCSFNYQDGDAEKCDIGVINLTEVMHTRDSGVLPSTADDTVRVGTPVTRTIRCGGKASNCIRGPITIESQLTGKSNGRVLMAATKNTAFTKAVTLASPFEVFKDESNKRYVNFRRDMANKQIDIGNRITDTFNVYRDIFDNFTNLLGESGKVFDPGIMESYASNRNLDQSTIITAPILTAYSKSPTKFAKPLAADPFLGIGTTYATNPFYTFYCLDGAYDIKARIRMAVREWDRSLPDDSSDTLEKISDVNFLAPIARQDVPSDIELSDDSDTLNDYNDKLDWDDFLAMERTPGGGYTSGLTIWRPAPDVGAGFPIGFFNPALFPNEAKP